MQLLYEGLRDAVPVQGVRFSRLLDASKLLYVARQPRFLEPILRMVVERVLDHQILGGDRMSDGNWTLLKGRTIEAGFGNFDGEDFRTYRPFYERIDVEQRPCVDYEPSLTELGELL